MVRRYRLKVATWTVIRESDQPSLRKLDTPEAVAAIAAELVQTSDDDKEHFWIALVNSQNHLLLVHEVAVGSQSAAIVHPREVLGPALREGAAHLILIHNHPSGDPTPSKEDLHLTRQLVEGAKLLGLKLHDHVIIGNGTLKWVSLAQKGLL